MGFYIECPSSINKAQQLREMYPDAEFVGEIPPPFDYSGKTVNICVVQNGPFDAAGIAFSPQEQKIFAEYDGRIKHWLTLTRKLILYLCPRVEKHLFKLNNPPSHQ